MTICTVYQSHGLAERLALESVWTVVMLARYASTPQWRGRTIVPARILTTASRKACLAARG